MHFVLSRHVLDWRYGWIGWIWIMIYKYLSIYPSD